MPTVIDSLVVKLGLDPSGFKTGSDEAQKDLHLIIEVANRTGRQLEDSGKQGALFFSQLKNEALGLIGTLVGATGLEQIVRRSTESMAQLGREATNLNVDPQKLAAFSMALERFGASGESTRQTLFGISQAVERFKLLGDPGVLKYLQVIGAGPQNSSFEILQRFIAYAQAHKKDAAQVNLIGQGLGIDQGTINAALQMKSLAQFQKEYNDALRDAPTKQQVEQAQQLQTAWVELEQAAKGVANAVTTDMTPALTSLLNWGKDEIHQHPQIAKDLAEIVAAITVLSGLRVSASLMGLTGLAGTLGRIATVIDGLLLLLPALGMTGPSSDLDKKNQGKAISAAEAAEEDWMRAHSDAPPQFSAANHWWLEHAPTALGGLPAVPASGDSKANMDAAEKYFLAQGYTPQQVAGILANIQSESGFNPSLTGDNGKAYGIAQWHADRQAQFQRLFGHSIQKSTYQEQLAFMQWELTHTEKKAGDELRGAKSRYQSGAVVSLDYERPAGGAQEADKRGTLAQQYNIHPAARAPASVPAANGPSTTTVHIGHVTVNTKATDARGIARDFGNEITAQANRGLV